MKNGGWVPLSKGLARALPHDRKFSEIEAAFSLQLDYDNGNTVTLSGYASLWRWSKDKVRRFLSDMSVEISYPKQTAKTRKQRGFLSPRNNLEQLSKSPRIRLILPCDSSNLDINTDLKKNRKSDQTVQKHATTIDPRSLKENVPFSEIVTLLNSATGKSFKATTKKTRTCIRARWHEGFRLDDFEQVIAGRVAAWGNGGKMAEYLRPETVFGQKFEGYLQASKEADQASHEKRPYDTSPAWIKEEASL